MRQGEKLTERTNSAEKTTFVSFDEWTGGRQIQSVGTNHGAPEVPFQKWRNFKEAFAPELIGRAISESRIPVRSCLDPFGGSGTTALACQFSGVHPITMEVNPYLADLIEAKLSSYNTDALARDLGQVLRKAARSKRHASSVFAHLPGTFVEPGKRGRWIFDRQIADILAKILISIDEVQNRSHNRFFRVILGGVLINLSNVVVSGKGRRYRRNWEDRRTCENDVIQIFCESAQQAISEIAAHSNRICPTYEVHRGDCRKLLSKVKKFDLCVFSPPYPNSFDYTDIYNVELWTLGYLDGWTANRKLRSSTISSHVQISRTFARAPTESCSLSSVVRRLSASRSNLWDSRIPEMVGGYFADLKGVLGAIHVNLHEDGMLWMVVGSSQYANVSIPTAKIISEICSSVGFKLVRKERCRSMRTSAQQGGNCKLAETLIVLSRI